MELTVTWAGGTLTCGSIVTLTFLESTTDANQLVTSIARNAQEISMIWTQSIIDMTDWPDSSHSIIALTLIQRTRPAVQMIAGKTIQAQEILMSRA